MRWTTRLKRHGGLIELEVRRELQLERITATIDAMPLHRQKMLKLALEWLQGSPLRVMSQLEEDYYWPQEAA